jgi:hypothetical protein
VLETLSPLESSSAGVPGHEYASPHAYFINSGHRRSMQRRLRAG